MPLKTPQQYIESLRDGRVTYWDGERIDDITTHPRFQVPIAMTAKDYDYNDPEYQGMRRYKAEDGGFAHRIYQIPHNEKDLADVTIAATTINAWNRLAISGRIEPGKYQSRIKAEKKTA